MADKSSPKRLAFSLGIIFGILHAIGVLLIFAGLLQYWSWAHFVSLQYTIASFSIIKFIVGTIAASVIGMMVGWLFAIVYNKLS